MKKGAQQNAKHKPNTRHTLNEVLHSLQDMMHNELAEIELPPEANATNPKGQPLSKEDALNNLKALIGSQPPASIDANDENEIDEIDIDLSADDADLESGVNESAEVIDIEIDEPLTDETIHAGELSNQADYADETDDRGRFCIGNGGCQYAGNTSRRSKGKKLANEVEKNRLIEDDTARRRTGRD